MSAEEPDQESEATEAQLDPAVTPELFREWRSPRLGTANPERMNNPVWEWLIRSKLCAYIANQRLNGPDAMDAGPAWCFNRYGQSSTQLPDGRIVLIAGEHEDHYDPDFYIYNDVVVLHADGKSDIYGYPPEAFPPTDFHSATLVGNRIVIIGCLGYPADRKPEITPVFILNLESFIVSPVQTSGTAPGRLYEHEAILADEGDCILVRNGKLDCGEKVSLLVENIDDWKLHLMDWRWERLTERRWERWAVVRKDLKPNHLWQIGQAVWSQSVGWNKEYQQQIEELKQSLGAPPELNLRTTLFSPAIPHEPLPQKKDSHNVYRIKVEGVKVRYVEHHHSVQMTVEGELPPATIETLTADLTYKISALENAPAGLKQL